MPKSWVTDPDAHTRFPEDVAEAYQKEIHEKLIEKFGDVRLYQWLKK